MRLGITKKSEIWLRLTNLISDETSKVSGITDSEIGSEVSLDAVDISAFRAGASSFGEF